MCVEVLPTSIASNDISKLSSLNTLLLLLSLSEMTLNYTIFTPNTYIEHADDSIKYCVW